MTDIYTRSDGRTSEAPPDERGGYRYVRPTATASHLDSTLFPRCRASWRRSPDRTLSRRSGWSVRTGPDAPKRSRVGSLLRYVHVAVLGCARGPWPITAAARVNADEHRPPSSSMIRSEGGPVAHEVASELRHYRSHHRQA